MKRQLSISFLVALAVVHLFVSFEATSWLTAVISVAALLSALLIYMVGSDSSGNRDPSSSESGDPYEASHLVIMVNGIFGSASDWRFGAEQLRSRFGNHVFVHCSARNAATLTIDGVDKMGHRLAEEVKEVVDRLPKLRRISFVAHSLGGLIARYAVGQLFGRSDSDRLPKNDLHDANSLETINGMICGLEPMNFITVATPHLGSRGSGQFPLLGGLTFLEKVAVLSAHLLVGRTGRHLFLTDNDQCQTPLLQKMVTDCSEGQFLSALAAFQQRVLYANVDFDHMVGYRTATIMRDTELVKLSREPIDEKYPHIVNIKDLPSEKASPDSVRKPTSDPVEEEMISGLRRLSWKRVDVSFSKSSQKIAAHSTIQVKHYWMHSDGADVIAHIVDNFVL